MNIISLDVKSYGTGSLIISLDDNTIINVSLTSDEADKIKQLGVEIFQSRQQGIADTIAKATPTALVDLRSEAAPPVYGPDDDIPF